MPLTEEEKAALVLSEGFSVDPYDSYIRIAKVIRTSLRSREMTVQYVDGGREEGEYQEGPDIVICVAGSDDPTTTYTPSSAVYGHGDLCCVLLTSEGDKYAVSLLDMYTPSAELVADPQVVADHSNRKNFALIQGWALLDVLNGLMVDFLDSGENSFISFWNPATHETVSIQGNPEKRHILQRILDYFTTQRQNTMDTAHVDYPFWPVEVLNGGPRVGTPFKINDILFEGKNVNGFPYIQDSSLFSQVDMTANLSPYHSTLTELDTASVHPAAMPTLEMFLEGARVITFGDEDPTHVLLVWSHPSWATVPYLKFVEVPVHALTGRKILEQEEDLPDNPGEFKITQSWQRYADCVREIYTIYRNSYIDFAAHESDVKYGEYLPRGLLTYTPRHVPPDPPTPGEEATPFGIIDGYGYDQNGVIFDISKLKKIEGTITRTEIEDDEEAYVNGSRYQYEISHNNPVSSGTVDNKYLIRFVYEWNDGNPWEEQTCLTPTKEYPAFTDGVNKMHRTLDFSYHCDGYYIDDGGATSGRISWKDGEGSDTTSGVYNELWWRMYLNDVLLFTDYWRLEKGVMFVWGESIQHAVHYADPEYGLFVVEKIVTVIDESSDSLGPGQPCTGTITKTGMVLFGGSEYVIWEFVRVLDTFPTWWNFFPWLVDAGAPERPETVPYSVDENHNSFFYYHPFFAYYSEPLPGYGTKASSYPAWAGDICSAMYVRIMNDNVKGKPSDYLQVSVDYESDSFIVKFPCFFPPDPPEYTLTYPNTNDTCFRFNGGAIHFNSPMTTSSITLSF